MEAPTRPHSTHEVTDSRTIWEAEAVAFGDYLVMRHLGCSPASVPQVNRKKGQEQLGRGWGRKSLKGQLWAQGKTSGPMS